jgi:hypothetical protein
MFVLVYLWVSEVLHAVGEAILVTLVEVYVEKFFQISIHYIF